MKHRHSGKYRTHSKAGKVCFKRMPKHRHTLKKRHRRMFQNLDKEKFETGGYMDFDEKGLERADVYIGKGSSVEFDDNPDKEVNYHTHPTTGRKREDKLNFFPSKDDVKANARLPSQAMLIMHQGKVTMATKRNKKRPTDKQINRIERGLNKDVNAMSVDQLFRKYKPEYKKMGLDLKYIKHKGSIKIPLEVVEPR